jgi:hypothetical protein
MTLKTNNVSIVFHGSLASRLSCGKRLVKEIRNWKNQILLAIGFAGLVQIGLHFWH